MKKYNLSSEQMEHLVNLAKAHNESVDNYINVTLKEYFGGDAIKLDQWFEAQQLIRTQNFYEKACSILAVIRAFDIDCKLDAQHDKLHCPEIGVFAY